MYTAADIFSGCGGFSLGMQAAGFDLRWAIERDQHAAASYRKLVGDHMSCVDVTQVDPHDFEPVDYLHASPPCQGFSSAGKRDPNDVRNSLWQEVIRFAAVLKPKIITLENVPGMLTSGAHLDIIAALEGVGYSCQWRKLDAAWYGVPQHRKRVIIVATLPGYRYQWPMPTHAAKPDMFSPSPYVVIDGFVDMSLPCNYANGITVTAALAGLKRPGIPPCKLGRPAYTIVATPAHPSGNWLRLPQGFRGMTIQEGGAFQGFSASQVAALAGNVSSHWRQIGNAVPVGLAAVVASSARKGLEVTS